MLMNADDRVFGFEPDADVDIEVEAPRNALLLSMAVPKPSLLPYFGSMVVCAHLEKMAPTPSLRTWVP